MSPIPTIGRIVHYRLSEYDAATINRRRSDASEKIDWHRALKSGAMVHVGNRVEAGHVYPAMIVRVWSDSPAPNTAVNLQVFLDGTDVFWATSTSVDDGDGKTKSRFTWPVAPAPTAVKPAELTPVEAAAAVPEDGRAAANALAAEAATVSATSLGQPMDEPERLPALT